MPKRLALLASTAIVRIVPVFDTGAPYTIVPQAARDAAKRAVAALVEAGDLIVGDVMLKRSTDSAAMIDYWNKTDAIVDGEDAVKAMHSVFLPKFAHEETEDYQVRESLIKFTNVYRDIVENLATKPFEEDVTLQEQAGDAATKPPVEIEDFIKDVDGAGNNITSFGATTFFNGINSAIDWIFVDFPTEQDTAHIRTVADAKASGIRPYWSHVLGRNVLEARVKVVNGKEMLVYCRIFEPGNGPVPDHVRVFERNVDGVVVWRLYVKTDQIQIGSNTQFKLEAGGVVSINVIPMIPFITGRRDGRTFRVWPAMKDAADLQAQLYQQESGLKFIKTMAGYPMLAANGIQPEKNADGSTKSLRASPMRVLYSKADAAGNVGTWGFVQPDAAILKFLADDVKDTIQQLRELGRQPLTAQSGNLTVITTAVAASKAKSAVGAWAHRLADALNMAIEYTCLWINLSGYKPQVHVFNEFDDFTDAIADIPALQQARTARDISRNTFTKELQRRKVLSAQFDADADLAELLEETPTGADLENPDDNNKPEPKK